MANRIPRAAVNRGAVASMVLISHMQPNYID